MVLRGVLLAGGTGTRMGIVSRAINKHCNLIYKLPMIMYPLLNLKECGISDILIVTSEVSAGQFIQILGNGEELELNLTYTFQKSAAGIADALRLGRKFAAGAPIVAILGDHFFHPPPVDIVKSWDGIGAKIILHPTDTPKEFGVVATDGVYYYFSTNAMSWAAARDKLYTLSVPVGHPDHLPDNILANHPIIDIIEKPQEYIGNLMVTGMYMYDNDVWNIIDKLEPSARDEYEISDVNNVYLARGSLQYEVYGGKWLDCGTPDKLLEASNYARNHGINN
jgi:glucose-1-phosphate thymidylyltransferase